MLLPAPDPREHALARTIGLPDLIARVLLARGLDDPDRIRRHLKPGLDELHDPFTFEQMGQATQRIRTAVKEGQRIMIHGDYDVDGITSCAMLVKFFRLMQADVKAHIPSRNDGYSFTEASLNAVTEGGFELCISVDNGTNACTYIDKIQAAGCDVIVTDHHGTTDNVADAHTILNPRLPGAGYPDIEIAGVGVAFTLARALATAFSQGQTVSSEFREFLLDAMTYVALGTVADVAPLRGENRILVHHGLRALAQSRNPGIRALLDAANLSHRSPSARDIGFRIAPLINAAGRMGRPSDAVDLFLAPGYEEAQVAARKLVRHNDARRRVEKRLTAEAMTEARTMDDSILVLGREGWHAGVLGIAASRVAETLRKPAILIAFEGGIGRGSGRSAGMLNLRDALSECRECMRSYGGHAAAVGLEIEHGRLDELRATINQRAGDRVQSMPAAEPDAMAELSELTPQSLGRLEMLGPFGAGNPKPTFASRQVKLAGQPTVDGRGRDLRFRVAQRGAVVSARIRNGAYRYDELRAIDTPVTLTYQPRIARWAERGPIELDVIDLRAEHPAQDKTAETSAQP